MNNTNLVACQSWHVLPSPHRIFEALLEVHVSEIFGLEVVISFYASTRDGHQSRSIRFEATPSLEIGMSRVVAAASSPSKQTVLLFPITTSTFCFFHVFLASHESRLTVSKPRTLLTVRFGGPQLLRTWRGKNHHCARAAYSANRHRILWRKGALCSSGAPLKGNTGWSPRSCRTVFSRLLSSLASRRSTARSPAAVLEQLRDRVRSISQDMHALSRSCCVEMATSSAPQAPRR